MCRSRVADGDLDGGVAVVERGEGLGPTDRGIGSAAPIAVLQAPVQRLSLDEEHRPGDSLRVLRLAAAQAERLQLRD